jgi:hypothetical protein
VVLLALVPTGWAAAVTLVWVYVFPGFVAGLVWGSVSEGEQQRADMAALAAVVLVVASPALAAWLAWRRHWRGAAYGLGALAVAVAVVFGCWLAVQPRA